jgi:hypothetical protein
MQGQYSKMLEACDAHSRGIERLNATFELFMTKLLAHQVTPQYKLELL